MIHKALLKQKSRSNQAAFCWSTLQIHMKNLNLMSCPYIKFNIARILLKWLDLAHTISQSNGITCTRVSFMHHRTQHESWCLICEQMTLRNHLYLMSQKSWVHNWLPHWTTEQLSCYMWFEMNQKPLLWYFRSIGTSGFLVSFFRAWSPDKYFPYFLTSILMW